MMNNLIPLYKNELKRYFYSTGNYVFIALFGLVNNWLFFQNFFLNQQASLSAFFQNLPFLLLFLIPALAMGLMSEEKNKGTWEILLSLPVKEAEIILSKYLAGFTVVIASFLTTIALPITVYTHGNPNISIILTGYLGALILSASYLALGVFVSSLTKQQTISFLITFAVLFVNDIFSQDYFLLRLPLSFRDIISSLSLTPYYQNIVNGLLTLKGIVFVMTWIITFIILSYFHLKSRKDNR